MEIYVTFSTSDETQMNNVIVIISKEWHAAAASIIQYSTYSYIQSAYSVHILVQFAPLFRGAQLVVRINSTLPPAAVVSSQMTLCATNCSR